jgi:hypothetical protein
MPQADTRITAPVRNVGPIVYQRQSSLAPFLGQLCVILLICAPILFPALRIAISDDLPMVKTEVAALPIVFIVYLWLLLAGEARLVQPNGMFLIGALFTFSVILSIWYGSSALGETVILRDFLEIPKLWLPIIFFTLAYEARLSEAALRRLLDFLALTVVPLCLYAWAQWGDLSVSHWLDNFYWAGEKGASALSYARRVYSTMGNANNFAELLTWLISAFLLALLLCPAKRTRYVLLALACLVSLTMTGSRYGLLDTTFALILIFAMNYASKGRKFSQWALPLALLPLFAGVFLAVSSSNERNLERFQTLDNPWQTDSFRERVDVLWRDAIRDFLQSPVLGHGPAKNVFNAVITDSEYLDVLKEFGVMGFLFYLAYYLFPLFLVWRGMRAGQRTGPTLEQRLPSNFLAMRLSFVMILTALLMNIGMSTFRNFLLQPFLWMWMGLGVRAARTIGEASRLRFSAFSGGHYSIESDQYAPPD